MLYFLADPVSGNAMEHSLIAKLMFNYSTDVRPAEIYKDIVTVDIDMALKQLIDMVSAFFPINSRSNYMIFNIIYICVSVKQ